MLFELVQIPKNTTTAGIRKQMYNAQIPIFGLVLQGIASNTGTVYLGDSRVSASERIVDLLAYDTFQLEIGKFFRNAEILMSDIWFDVSVTGEGLTGGMIISKDQSAIHQYEDIQVEQIKLLKEISNLLKFGGKLDAIMDR